MSSQPKYFALANMSRRKWMLLYLEQEAKGLFWSAQTDKHAQNHVQNVQPIAWLKPLTKYKI